MQLVALTIATTILRSWARAPASRRLVAVPVHDNIINLYYDYNGFGNDGVMSRSYIYNNQSRSLQSGSMEIIKTRFRPWERILPADL